MINGIDANGLGTKNIEQAFVSLKPKGKDSGFQMDFGKFVTSAGAEVIESNANWNYSRSLLFSWAIPYYHFGFRATETKGHFTGGFQLVNGWNNVDDNNSGKTLGFVGNVTSKKISWMNNYYTGPENSGTNTGWRNLYDTTVLFTPADKFSAYVNFDYGQNKSGTGATAATAKWYGVAFAGKVQMNDRTRLRRATSGSRIETGSQPAWFALQGRNAMPSRSLPSPTSTSGPRACWPVSSTRRDWTKLQQPGIFQRGSTGSSDHQDTFALGVVAFFGPKISGSNLNLPLPNSPRVAEMPRAAFFRPRTARNLPFDPLLPPLWNRLK